MCAAAHGNSDRGASLASLVNNNNNNDGNTYLSSSSLQPSLLNLSFHSRGTVGRMLLDSGTSHTAAAEQFVRAAGLAIRPLSSATSISFLTATGQSIKAIGQVDIPITIQLMLDVSEVSSPSSNTAPVFVHWDRSFVLRDVFVLPLGDTPLRDIFVSYSDWGHGSNDSPPSPLASIVDLISHGATIYDQPRAPRPGDAPQRVVILRERPTATIGALQQEPPTDVDGLRTRILSHIPAAKHSTQAVQMFLDELLDPVKNRSRVFGPVDPSECTISVDFELTGEPVPVSFRVPISKRSAAAADAANATLTDWISRGICKVVPWDTPAFGFVIVVPKANGKFRTTINPSGTNAATLRVDPDGGYMPKSLLFEALTAGRKSIAHQLDMTDAFLTLKLGPTAQRVSTFTSPLGKLQWSQGYFGWHSFPATFQRMLMEHVVLPTLDEFPNTCILAWIDDILPAAKNDFSLASMSLALIDRILSIGGRLSIDKCSFFITQFDWCGVEVDLQTAHYRVARHRVESLTNTPIPTDRTALEHVLGILRYYYWGVSDHKAQRARIALLAELNISGIQISREWTPQHTAAMRDALDAIVSGDWILVFNPSLPVYVTTDASGNHGYCVTAYQADSVTGLHRPIAFFSHGWLSTQFLWTPQVKEMYAIRQAVVKVMPEAFPYATVILLCDNRNLSSRTQSEDPRVTRWQHDVQSTGCITRFWIPGDFNTIADYGSRSVVSDRDATLSSEDSFQHHIFALQLLEGAASPPTPWLRSATQTTVVPGHLHMPPMISKIIEAQNAAPSAEKSTWKGSRYSTLKFANSDELHTFDGCAIIPDNAVSLQQELLTLAHDHNSHYTGTERTIIALRSQCRVWWRSLPSDAARFISSCFRCSFAKTASHGKLPTGTLSPTASPHVHHTWYADFKGPLPYNTGYLLCIVEAVTRFVILRYVPSANAKELTEEMEEAIASFGTAPVIIRSDGGPPFNSSEYSRWCAQYAIQPVLGAHEHSQGQGKVETRFRNIASSLIAVLGARASRGWAVGPLLMQIQTCINTSYCEAIRGTPSWALAGREPRTRLSAVTDMSSTNDSAKIFDNVTVEDLQNIISEHHAHINHAQGRAQLASSIAQAQTKSRYDSNHSPPNFKVNDWVLVKYLPANRLQPFVRGPYQITALSPDNNMVVGVHYVGTDTLLHKWTHVSRLEHFDSSRVTREQLVKFQLEDGSGVVEDVLEHHTLDDGSIEFTVKWFEVDQPSRLPGHVLSKVTKVINYCSTHGLPFPGTERSERRSVRAPRTRARK